MSLYFRGALAFVLFIHCASGRGTDSIRVDAIRTLFEKGRSYASTMMARIDAAKITIGTDRRVIEFIRENQYAVANDIHKSPHKWVTEASSDCAKTAASALSEIVLSVEVCLKTISNPIQASHNLIKQSVYHFGIKDERFIESVAVAINDTWVKSLVEGDQGFRYNARTLSCENRRGEAGYNLKFFGECGDFMGADLSHISFREKKVRGINLSFSDLMNTQFEDVSARGADLSFARLTKVWISGANFDDADFSHSELLDMFSISPAYFRQAKLRYAKLQGTFSRTDFSRADLTGANLSETELNDSNFSGANLSSTKFNRAILIKTNFQGANLEGADFRGAHLGQADFRIELNHLKTYPDLSGACFDGNTRLPFSNEEAKKRGMIRKFFPGPHCDG